MKSPALITALAAALALTMGAAFAGDKTKEVTVKGEGMCAKCAMKETDSCQNAIQVTKDGETMTYYLAKNDVSKAFHKNLCKANAAVVATGTVSKDEDGKHVLTVSSIDLDS